MIVETERRFFFFPFFISPPAVISYLNVLAHLYLVVAHLLALAGRVRPLLAAPHGKVPALCGMTREAAARPRIVLFMSLLCSSHVTDRSACLCLYFFAHTFLGHQEDRCAYDQDTADDVEDRRADTTGAGKFYALVVHNIKYKTAESIIISII